ncbi:MAG: glycosyltransferase [Slackia sp.]|nr:glycosyltransferase [Slackia sp.]
MKISIIVPVYKAEKHLGATLDSLIGQTHADLEIICVNDGSPDGCAHILETYAARDARIVVFDQENQGVSAARNTGIAHATGDILMFVDADDTLVACACARVNEVFETQQPDVFTFGLECDPPEAAPASLRRELAPKDMVYEGFEPALLFKDHARPYACRTAIAHDFAQREQVRFEEGLPLAEDQVFYFGVYPFSKRTVLSSEKLYIYRMNDESVTHEAICGRDALLKKLDSHLTAIEAICRIWTERGMHDFCAAELLEWCLDFTMLDIGKLPAADQHACYARLMECLDAHFGKPCENFARRRPTKACLADIRGARENDPVIAPSHKVRYYLMRRGLLRCAERVLMKLGIVK